MKLKKSNFIAKLFRKRKLKLAPKIYSATSLHLHPDQFSSAVLTVVSTLQQKGYQAYIVGGGVRDQLLGLTAKDFDVATDAHPEQVKRCFQRCLIIGKRFRLAHVYINRRDYIEVATFRAGHEQAKHKDDAHVKHEGIISRDNVYGTIEEDALRRDFSVNALYYDPIKEVILDFNSGLEDLQNKTLRLLGKPDQRLQEDPVRILRGIRISCKLNFTMDTPLLEAIPKHLPLLSKISGGRLFDEYTKLFLHGKGLSNFHCLRKYNAFAYLFPETEIAFKEEWFKAMVEHALDNTDLRIHSGKTIHPAFLIAVFLYAPLKQRNLELQSTMSKKQALITAVEEVLKQQAKTTSMPNYFGQMVRDIWFLQRALELKRKTKVLEVLANPRFRAAYDFALLRASVSELSPRITEFWTEAQSLDERKLLAKITTTKKSALTSS